MPYTPKPLRADSNPPAPPKLSALAKLNGFSDEATYEGWCKRQWADLDARDAARAAAYQARLAANERARGAVRFWPAVAVEAEARLLRVEAFWEAVAAEGRRLAAVEVER